MAAALAKARLESAMNSLAPRLQKFINAHIRKGENFELKTELNSEYRERRKEAVKRVIANMTVGKDVSGLFADVLKCMQTDDLELKKLVYLYLMNYARSQPELVILAVNSFVKDAEDSNPLIRALAVRTMGCLRSERIVDYLTEPLRKTLRDRDPYVRKTAAICVAKMYDLMPYMTVDGGFVGMLQEMLSDPNPMVIANAVAALREISEHALEQHAAIANLRINAPVLNKLLAALNECTEWGQIFILECLSEYTPCDTAEAENIIERVIPRLAHANGSVVLSAVRVLLLYMNHGTSDATKAMLLRKMSPSLVSLLGSSHELAYVVLRNINLILQHQALLPPAIRACDEEHVGLLASEMRMFFCKYNDPQYVKMEKLEILLKLATPENVNDIIQELAEYSKEVDVPFVRKAVSCIGGCALLIKTAAEPAMIALCNLLQSEAPHIVQEAVVVSTHILRRYPNSRVDAIVPLLCAKMESLNEEGSRCALLWLLGFHADKIPNAELMLAEFAESFNDESITVQLQTLTAALYCNIHRRNAGSGDTQSTQLLHFVLQRAMNCEKPDLRDRAYVYWRLLSLPAATASNALAAVLGTLPPSIKSSNVLSTLKPETITGLLPHLGTLASLRHELPHASIYPGRVLSPEAANPLVDEDEEDAGRGGIGTLSGTAGSPAFSPQNQGPGGRVGTSAGAASGIGQQHNIVNLLDIDLDVAPAAGDPPASQPSAPRSVVLLTREAGNGIEIQGAFSEGPSATQIMTLQFTNYTNTQGAGAAASDFAIQFNKNHLGLFPMHGIAELVGTLAPGKSAVAPITLSRADAMVVQNPASPNLLQIAVKSSLGIVYFNASIPDAWLSSSTAAPKPLVPDLL